MKIGIFQDIHANFPALKKSLEIFKEHNCEKIVHVGDLIGIGPHPKEVFDLAIKTKDILFIMGNHDHLYAYGIPIPRPALMNEVEYGHQLWNHQQLGEEDRKIMQAWNFIEQYKMGTKKVTFMHYGFDEKTKWFKNHIQEPTVTQMDQMFEEITTDMIFYGHNHFPSDLTGNARYVNLGSAGCNNISEVRLGILEMREDKLHLEKIVASYNDDGLMEDFELRKVPAREFITKNFITRK